MEATRMQLREARLWLLDCGCPEDLLSDQNDVSVQREVERQYAGGWAQFVEDAS